ncbi:transposase, partial [Neisseria sp. P0021.S006]|uniref:transposase n=1 Tax=Neisseria sp. P0021.S006 TaxID=3436821 RepID=UPI003F7DF0A9
MTFTDTHCHLADPKLASTLPTVLAEAQAAGVARFIVPATSTKDWHSVAQLERPSENIQSLKRLLSLQNQLKEQLTAQKNRLKAAKDSFVQQIHQKQIDELNQHLQDVDGQIKQTAKADKAIQETAKRLQTIPSVGQTTAIYLTVHLLTAHFKNANHFTAFAGMSPQQKKSGTSVNGKEKLTRYGNRKLRGALFMAAMVAMRQNYFPDFTKRLQKAKKPKMVIICALMRKLLVIAYHLHKNQTDFD